MGEELIRVRLEGGRARIQCKVNKNQNKMDCYPCDHVVPSNTRNVFLRLKPPSRWHRRGSPNELLCYCRGWTSGRHGLDSRGEQL